MTQRPERGRLGLTGPVLALGLAVLTGCSPIYRTHGFVPSQSEVFALQPGVDTRESVADVIGQPTAGGVLNNGGFYYVQSRFRHFGPLAPEEIDRQVVALSFDAEGTLRNIERFGLEQGRVVALEREVTDDGLRDTTFLRQLMGNFGTVTAEQLFGGDE